MSEPIGYIVLTRNRTPKRVGVVAEWTPDWDGEIHEDARFGMEAAAEAAASLGHEDVMLVQCFPVEGSPSPVSETGDGA